MSRTNLNEEHLRELLSPLVDSGTELRVTQLRDSFVVAGRRRFQDFSFEVVEDGDGAQLSVIKKRGSIPLRQYLGSSLFADLDRLARSMIPFLKKRLEDVNKVVEGMSVLERDPGDQLAQARSASAGVNEALYMKGDQGTVVTFLYGDAGAGKSWLLMKIALEQMQQFLTRQRAQFPLYVDAQGVNLRSISQQIAHQLDIYNGVLRYTDVIPLVRLGTIGLIIDGFDELIMPSGYNDTLRALMTYIEDFRGEGAVVASARTSFLHAYSLSPLKHEPLFPYQVTYLRLKEWTATERSEYAEKHGRPELAEKLETLVNFSEANDALLGRPFLVAHVFSLLNSGNSVRPDRLLDAVEDAFVERERNEKLLDLDREEPLLSRAQFDLLLEEIAEEMWVLRQNSIDRQTARIVTAIVAEQFGLTRSELEVLEEKIDTHSFLEPESGERIRFPHEILFSRVIARRFLRWLRDEDFIKLSSSLRIAPIKVSTAEQFVSLVVPEAKPTKEADDALGKLGAVASAVPRSAHDSNVLLNLGSFVAYLLPFRRSKKRLVLEKLQFSGVSFERGNLSGLELKGAWLQDVDARGADWSSVEFHDAFPIGRLIAAQGQKFPDSLPSVHELHLVGENGRTEVIYGSSPTRSALFGEVHGGSGTDSVDQPMTSAAIELLEALCLKVQQGHHWIPLKDTDEDVSFRNLRRNLWWDDVVIALEELELLYRARRSRSGPDSELGHLRKAREILGAIGGEKASPEIRRLLSRLRALE